MTKKYFVTKKYFDVLYACCIALITIIIII